MTLASDSRAKKILDDETAFLQSLASELAPTLDSPRKTLFAVAKLFNYRQRYFGKVGEFFNTRDIDGMNIVDPLDHKLFMSITELIKSYKNRCQEEPELARPLKPQAVKLVKKAVKKNRKRLPEYPVAYIMLYTMQLAFEAFDPIIYNPPGGFTETELETAFLEELQAIVELYLIDRKTQVKRHLCDIAREYSVVSRLECKCAKGDFEIAKQSLEKDIHGNHCDKLEIKCKKCGSQRSLTFDLPNFADTSRAKVINN